MNKLVINSPSLQSLRQRFASAILTLIFWIIWIHLWLPLITLIGWLFGIDTFYFHMIELEGYVSLLSVLKYYAIAILIVGSILSSWALFNYLRFRNVERRKPAPPVTLEDLCETFGVDSTQLRNGQTSRLLTVQFDKDGHITKIRNGGDAPASQDSVSEKD